MYNLAIRCCTFPPLLDPKFKIFKIDLGELHASIARQTILTFIVAGNVSERVLQLVSYTVEPGVTVPYETKSH